MSRYTPLEEINKLPVKVIQGFLKSGQSAAIPAELQQYIREIGRVSEIWNTDHEHNISRIARKMQETFPEMAFNTARDRVYDAINYFHLNSTVKAAAWDNYYADRMEDLARLAIAANNYTQAGKFMELAREYRKEASANTINPDEIKPIIQLVNPSVDAKQLGLKEDFNLRTLWTDTEKFIDKLPADERAKQQAKQDAALNLGIEDADYELIDG